ncbi:hypothetical protein SDC9_76988 [bioreactor metagenome]|uniref:YgjP-like metallopeptidase domain-containing protein n=1 Tax=bioreactor metagenome TaxID=1076179 RepID=A0A644YR26_9ZZZZ
MNKSNTLVKVLWRGEIPIEIHRKAIKNSYYRMKNHPLRLECSIPYGVSDAEIEQFLVLHDEWIQKQWQKMQHRASTEIMYEQGDTILLWGKPVRLEFVIVEGMRKPSCYLRENHLIIQSGVLLNVTQREKLVYEFYKNEMKSLLPSILTVHSKRMGVTIPQWGMKRMKTRWGSCNSKAKRIWLNVELAKRDQQMLIYVVIHELAHLLIPNHGPQFYLVMDRYCPSWKSLRKELKY